MLMEGGGTVRNVCVYIYYIDMYNIDGGRRNCEKCVCIYILYRHV